jgi:hypothetical protein
MMHANAARHPLCFIPGNTTTQRCTADPANSARWKELFEDLRGRPSWGGLDLAVTSDLTSLCLAFPPEVEGGRWHFLWRFWLPEAAVRRAPLARRKRYEHFRDIGALTVTGGNVTDFRAVEAQIIADAEAYPLRWLGIDRYNAAQLAAIWASIRFGCPVPRTPTRGICSEDVARLLFPILDLREPGKSFDHADPNSVYRQYLALQIATRHAAERSAASVASPNPQPPHRHG